MSPVAPMPQASPVGTNGLKSWVMEVSGELSMTRVLPVVLALELELALVLELDEHAASPPASTAAAPTANSRLWLCNLLISFVFLSLRLWGLVRGRTPTFRVTRRRARALRRPAASRPRPAWQISARGPGPPGGSGHRRTGTGG